MDINRLSFFETCDAYLKENPNDKMGFIKLLFALPVQQKKEYKRLIEILPNEDYKRLVALFLVKKKADIEKYELELKNKKNIEKYNVIVGKIHNSLDKSLYNEKGLKKEQDLYEQTLSDINNVISSKGSYEEKYKYLVEKYKKDILKFTVARQKFKLRVTLASIIFAIIAIASFMIVGMIPTVKYEVISKDNADVVELEATGIKGLIFDFHFPTENLEIKSKVDDATVVRIADYAFSNTKIKSITIPSTVTRIGEEAFLDCSNLTTINLNVNGEIIENTIDVRVIEKLAFGRCVALTNLTITNQATQINKNAFDGCSNEFIINYEGSSSSWLNTGASPYLNIYFGYNTIKIKDGNSRIQNIEVANDEEITTLPTYSKEGYKFVGLVDKDGNKITDNLGNVLNPFYVTKSIDLYIKYEPLEFEINIDGESYIVCYGEHFDLPKVTKDGYIFMGYYTEPNGKGIKITNDRGNSTSSWTYLENVTLYPYLKLSESKLNGEKDVTITFKKPNGYLEDTITLHPGDSIGEYDFVFMEYGKVFDGWYLDKQCTQKFNFDEPIFSDLTLYAGFITVGYDLNINSVYTQKHYSFSDFYSTSILYMSPETHKINIKNGNSFLITITITNITENAIILDSKQIGAGDSFVCDIFEDSNDIIQVSVVPSNYDFYVWEIEFLELDEINVTGNYILVQKGLDFSIPLPKNIEKGYIFQYYYITVNGQDVPITDEHGVGLKKWEYDKTFELKIAKEKITYSIEYILNDGNLPSDFNLVENYNVETGKIYLPELEKVGYIFDGWYDQNGELRRSISSKDACDYILTARFSAKKYNVRVEGLDSITVSFNTMGGTTIESQKITKDKQLEYPQNPTKDGYIFTGWFYEKECVNPYSYNDSLAVDTVLYAGWMKSLFPEENEILDIWKYDENNPYKLDFSDENSYIFYYVFPKSSNITLSFTTEEYTFFKLCVIDISAGLDVLYNNSFFVDIYTNTISMYGEEGKIFIFSVSSGNSIDVSISIKESELVSTTTLSNLVVDYNSDFYITIPNTIPEGKKFVGYFTKEDGQGIQLTDEFGYSLDVWSLVEDICVYPYFE